MRVSTYLLIFFLCWQGTAAAKTTQSVTVQFDHEKRTFAFLCGDSPCPEVGDGDSSPVLASIGKSAKNVVVMELQTTDPGNKGDVKFSTDCKGEDCDGPGNDKPDCTIPFRSPKIKDTCQGHPRPSNIDSPRDVGVEFPATAVKNSGDTKWKIKVRNVPDLSVPVCVGFELHVVDDDDSCNRHTSDDPTLIVKPNM